MSGQDVTGVGEYAEKAARDAQREISPELVQGLRAAISDSYYDARNTGRTMESAADDAVERVAELCASVDANAHARGAAEARAEERERIAQEIEACICDYSPSSDGPERECPRHGEEAAEFYLGHAARIARGEATCHADVLLELANRGPSDD